MEKNEKNIEIEPLNETQGNKKTDKAYSLLKEHCPTVMDSILGKDYLLKEAAESALCWNVLALSSGDINYVVRALSEMQTVPINKIEASETRFIEIKRIIIKARGDVDLNTMADAILNENCINIMNATNNDNEDIKIKKAAVESLSKSLFGHKTADLSFIKKHIMDNVEDERDGLKLKIKNAELNFIEVRELIVSLITEFKENEDNGFNEVIKSIQFGIAKYNILFVLLLVVALAFAAQYLSQQALPLVAAAIGAASAHLLAERNTVLSGQSSSDKSDCSNCG